MDCLAGYYHQELQVGRSALNVMQCMLYSRASSLPSNPCHSAAAAAAVAVGSSSNTAVVAFATATAAHSQRPAHFRQPCGRSCGGPDAASGVFCCYCCSCNCCRCCCYFPLPSLIVPAAYPAAPASQAIDEHDTGPQDVSGVQPGSAGRQGHRGPCRPAASSWPLWSCGSPAQAIRGD